MLLTEPAPIPAPFDRLRFIWSELESQYRRESDVDGIFEHRLGPILYVDDVDSLPDRARERYQTEIKWLYERLDAIALIKNAIGQSLIIAVDTFMKAVTSNAAHVRCGPQLPACGFSPASPQIWWAEGVRVAGNYVRHGGEWKHEALQFQSDTGRDAAISDFKRPDTQRNLTTLTDALGCTVSQIMSNNLSYVIAQKLQLTSSAPCVLHFQQWKTALPP